MSTSNATPAETAVNPPTAATPVDNRNIIVKPAVGWLTRDSDAVVIAIITRIIESMNGNVAYAHPVPTLAAVGAARDAFVLAVNLLDRGRAAQIRRNDARAEAVRLTRELAVYVLQACKGNLGVLVSSGFPVQKSRRASAGVLDAPVNLQVLQGKLTGQLIVRCKVVRSAKAYQWRYATAAAPTVWTLSDPVTSSRNVLEDLTAGTSYIVQARAVGSQGAGNWSESATMTVL